MVEPRTAPLMSRWTKPQFVTHTLPYKVVTRKLGTHPPDIEAKGRELVTSNHLFPQLPRIDWSCSPMQEHHKGDTTDLRFTQEELASAATRLPSGKACGPDSIPNEILKIVARLKPRLLSDVFSLCLKQGTYPRIWKESRLVLLH